jgi:hypothetical protein
MYPQLKIQEVSIVLRGAFNPAIFHPSWLAAQDLIRSQEAEEAEIGIVHPQVAQFESGWLRMNVTTDRFQVDTSQEPFYEPLRDLVIGICQIMVHTPLRVVGINRDFHYGLASEDTWHAVGHRLVPKQDWEEVLSSPGMRTLTVEGQRPDGLQGYIRVRVEPSTRVLSGVYTQVNDHYVLPSANESPASAREVIAIISEQWTQSMERGLQIAEKIVSLGEHE